MHPAKMEEHGLCRVQSLAQYTNGVVGRIRWGSFPADAFRLIREICFVLPIPQQGNAVPARLQGGQLAGRLIPALGEVGALVAR